MSSSDSDAVAAVSYSYIRENLKLYNKFEVMAAMLGKHFATQELRPIGRLHSHFAGIRTELDYTKYAEFLFPTDGWNEPLMYYTGIGIDDHSGVAKGFVRALAPSTRETVRLYRRCVLPKSMWLPAHLRHVAAEWDAFGLEVIVAIDNAPDFTSHGASLMFLVNGTIILRMPVKRGDLKGSVERTIQTVEQQHISAQSGFVASEYAGLDERYKQQRLRAMLKASRTVAQAEADFVPYLIEFNDSPHPTLRKSRSRVFRDSQERFPLLLPCGRSQIRSNFALTYNPKLLREGVQVEELKYNSKALNEAFLTYSGKVIVKVDPDDIRSVLVLVPNRAEPIEAYLTTLDIDFPLSLELVKVLFARIAAKHPGDTSWMSDPEHELLTELNVLQSGPPTRTEGKTVATDAAAAAHAAAAPPVAPPPSRPVPSLEELLRGSQLDDGDE
jgi:hypothetical protein